MGISTLIPIEIIEQSTSLWEHIGIRTAVQHFGGLSNSTKPWRHLADQIIIHQFNRKQFDKFQNLHIKIEFLSGVQMLSITKNRRILTMWMNLRNMAYDYYTEAYRSAAKDGRLSI